MRDFSSRCERCSANDCGVIYIPEASGSVVAHHVFVLHTPYISKFGGDGPKRVHVALHKFPYVVSIVVDGSVRFLVECGNSINHTAENSMSTPLKFL